MALSTAWERVATGQRVATVVRVGGSHLSPDGGGLSRAAVHRLGAGGYGAAGGYGLAAVAYTLISCHLYREAIRRTRGRRV